MTKRLPNNDLPETYETASTEREIMMDFVGTYQLKSHFWKVFSHPGTLIFTRDADGTLKGKAIVLVIQADAEDLVTEGNRFSFVMRKSVAGIRVEMKTSGTIDEDGNVTAVMEAPFGTSHIEVHRIG